MTIVRITRHHYQVHQRLPCLHWLILLILEAMSGGRRRLAVSLHVTLGTGHAGMLHELRNQCVWLSNRHWVHELTPPQILSSLGRSQRGAVQQQRSTADSLHHGTLSSDDLHRLPRTCLQELHEVPMREGIQDDRVSMPRALSCLAL